VGNYTHGINWNLIIIVIIITKTIIIFYPVAVETRGTWYHQPVELVQHGPH